MKKILILMIEVGSSHKMSALAVKDAIEKIAPDRYQIKVMDFAKEVGALNTDRFLKNSWDTALAHPNITKVINRAIDVFFPITHSRNLLKVLFRKFTQKGIEFIRENQPDIVYTTHFFCSSIAAIAKERYHLPFEVINTMTDPFFGHKMLIDNHLDYVLAANPIAADYLINNGMKKEKVKIIPLPIHSKFFKVIGDKDYIRAKFNLDKNKLTLLVSAGGQGIGKSEEYIEAIFHRALPINIIAVCGNNQNLFHRLQTLKIVLLSPRFLLLLSHPQAYSDSQALEPNPLRLEVQYSLWISDPNHGKGIYYFVLF